MCVCVCVIVYISFSRGDRIYIFPSLFTQATLDWYQSFLHPLTSSRGANLLLIGDTPKIAEVPWLCPPEWKCQTAYASIAASGAVQREVEAKRFAYRHTDVFFLSTWDLFCDTAGGGARSCGSLVPGTAFRSRWDNTHLNRAGSMYLWPYLCAAFEDRGLFGGV